MENINAGESPHDSEINRNWSEAVEDLISSGDTDAAISRLESEVSRLQLLTPASQVVDLQLASAFTELATLYSSKDFSLKADELRSRACLLNHRALHSRLTAEGEENLQSEVHDQDLNSNTADSACDSYGPVEKTSLPSTVVDEASDDDWEAVADRESCELLPANSPPSVSKTANKDKVDIKPKRRGRGTFSYKKNRLYSDQQSDGSVSDDSENEKVTEIGQQSRKSQSATFGTHHVLVLADVPPSTKTTDLERLLDGFKHHGVSVRWVNDTTALAVFRSPSIDLEPPRQRPQTSTRTAQRLIAQGMGLKLPSSSFGSRDLKNQEEARKKRIVRRQKLRDDAWGED
ncbi:hypothetical protein LINPERPRIM_LOCUS6409 [Linum perenne]